MAYSLSQEVCDNSHVSGNRQKGDTSPSVDSQHRMAQIQRLARLFIEKLVTSSQNMALDLLNCLPH